MWKENLELTKQHYIDWWNHKGIVLNMWEHFQTGVAPHADVPAPPAPKDLNQKWFDPEWRAEYLDWYVAHSCLKADMLPVANTQLGPGSLAAILGGVFEGGEDTIWIHPDPSFNDDITFNPEHPNYLLHKDLLRACKQKAQGNYYVGMPDLMEGMDVLAALKGTDKVLMDTVTQPDVLEHQMQQINDIYFRVFDELYDIIREGDEMAFCYFSSWAPGKMTKLQSDISTMISVEDYRRFVQPFIRQQCQKIDYTLYHLDGVGALHHLPALLEIEELNAIQWTPGVGEPQGGSPKWYELYKKILAAGKSIMACWVTVDELRPLLDNIGGDGRQKCDYYEEQIKYSADNGRLARGLAKCIVDADYLINSALLKTHKGPGVTLTAKNWYGATDINLQWRKNAHNGFSPDKKHGKPGYKTFVDFIGHKDLGQKCLLFLIDGTYGSRDVNGKPNPKWRKPPFNGDWCCSIIASQDPLACDAVGMDLLIGEWPEFGSFNYCDEYLREAATIPSPVSGTKYDPEQDGKPLDAPLGLMEHWNNPQERKYTKLDMVYKKL